MSVSTAAAEATATIVSSKTATTTISSGASGN
jgi:hypothetical protein